MNNHKSNSEIIIYQADDGTPKIEVRIEDETIWLTQGQMASLFDKAKSTISGHIKNIFIDGELDETVVIRKFRTTTKHGAIEGKTQMSDVNLYNLDVVISVGYRVKSIRGTQFRMWATKRLREYIQKGFVMDDERLKQAGGGGYWKELLNRIRDIRSSEKVFYRQILDIYATSIDYKSNADESIAFFKKVQNKIHYAVHGQTASELIYSRVDAEKEFMGLMTFSGDRPHLVDAVIAKNYLKEKELRALNQIVSGYLDFAERQAEREIPMKMKDWALHLDGILTATGEQLLQNAGSISHEKALNKVKTEYKKFQSKTISSAERDYLDVIKTVQKKVEQKVKAEKQKPKGKK
ncbi:MAG TPA: cell filamentation protein Fic [Methanosarcinaceae archaeon]|nr:cell filamentation protein Fic [Methanosarcinaceae archaeon]